MAYEKQDWSNGDIISEEKLNHIEDGISNALTEVDASALVNGADYLEVSNNIIDVKYSELKSDIATDIIKGSNYIDDLYGYIDVNLSKVSQTFAKDTKYLTWDVLESSDCFDVDVSKVAEDFVKGSDYLTASIVNETPTLNVNVSAVGRALTTNSESIGYYSTGFETKSGIGYTLSDYQGDIQDTEQYATFSYFGSAAGSVDSVDVPSVALMEAYVAAQGGGGGGGATEGSVTYNFNVSGPKYFSYIDSDNIGVVIQDVVSFGGELHGLYTVTGSNPPGGEYDIGYIPGVVYHDADGFYTIDGTTKQYITVS